MLLKTNGILATIKMHLIEKKEQLKFVNSRIIPAPMSGLFWSTRRRKSRRVGIAVGVGKHGSHGRRVLFGEAKPSTLPTRQIAPGHTGKTTGTFCLKLARMVCGRCQNTARAPGSPLPRQVAALVSARRRSMVAFLPPPRL
jgi:hypothetical protein